MGSRGSRAFYALVRDADGRRKTRLGPAWVKDSGKRTARGAVKWAVRDGSKPDGYLTPAEAEEILSKMLAAAPRRVHRTSAATSMTLRQACDHWLTWAETDSEVKRSTLGDYGNVCDRLCRDLGAGTRVASLTTKGLEKWIDGMQAERRLSPAEARKRRKAGVRIRQLPDGSFVQLTPASPRTRRKYLVNLNGIMKRAMKLGAITSNPVTLVDRPGRLRKRRTLATTQFLRPVDVHALVRAASEVNAQDGAIFMTSAFCGLRLGELLDLRWGAVNFAGSSIHVESSYVRNASGTPKSGMGRTVPMAPDVARALAEHSKVGPVKSDADLVFVGRDGRHVDANALRLRYYAALDRAGLKRIRIHDLRHTFGTVCAAKGIPQTTIKEWMGHSDLATTEIYTAFYPQDSDAAKISAAFAEESGPALAGSTS
ncbi:MAG: site-specific integrase [Solirubrobacteraceae bacterium]